MPSPVQSNCDVHDTIANGQYGAVWSMGHTQQIPVGWRSWLVAGLMYPRLRVHAWTKSAGFSAAGNRQRQCRMIIRHEKDPLNVRLA
ncbi:hypothetical protein TNCV_4749941 [Trichonephila clavipes]|nr:hypothetical protein TNCV_4749941 [Trichonephila clavipes]